MPHLISKKHLNRRLFLRGAGTLLALPWFDAMVPAVANAWESRQAMTPPQRFVAVNYGLGFHGPHLFPQTAGKEYEMTPYLAKLEENKEHFSVISGLSHPEQNGANGHTSELTILTSAKFPGLPGFKNTVSLDQYMVEKLVPDTRFQSLILNVRSGDSISWSSNGVNLPAQSSPENLFRSLFINGSEAEVNKQLAEIKRGKSILDTVNDRAKKLHNELGPRDQEKFDQYLTSVRELEVRLQASQEWAKKPKPKVDVPQPKDVAVLSMMT